MRVLGRPSSINVRKVLWTIDEIGVAAIREEQWGTPDASTQSPEFLALNPNGLVPVLVDEAGILTQSNAICRYLARKHGRDDLLPRDPAGAAAVEQWMDWQATELNGAWRDAFMGLVRKDPAFADPERIAASAAQWNAAMAVLDGRLASAPYAAGEKFTLADIGLGLSAHRWRATPIAHADLPHVARWMAQLEARPAFAQYTVYP